MLEPIDLRALAAALRGSRAFAAKADIGVIASRLGLSGRSTVPVGDDCAAIADGEGYLVFAIEGFINEFVAGDPWFAGWCAVMVNISDVAAMGGRPLAVVDAIWAEGAEKAENILAGMRAASDRYGVPIVGGHTNIRCDRGQLSAAILGRAKRLLTSFDARPGDRLIAAIDLRGRYREPFSNWEAATEAPALRLRGDLELLPEIAEAGLSRAAKDISQGGIVGTAAMLAECSGVAINIDVRAMPKPESVPLDRWLLTFPSFGYLIAVAPENVAAVTRLFSERNIAAADIGAIHAGHTISITDDVSTEPIWNFFERPLLGCALREAAA
jgi:uncharacterized protein